MVKTILLSIIIIFIVKLKAELTFVNPDLNKNFENGSNFSRDQL